MQKVHVEISRARDRVEPVTDNAAELRAQLETVTGKRIAALDGIGEIPREASGSCEGVEAASAGGKPLGTARGAAQRRSTSGRASRTSTSPTTTCTLSNASAMPPLWAMRSKIVSPHPYYLGITALPLA